MDLFARFGNNNFCCFSWVRITKDVKMKSLNQFIKGFKEGMKLFGDRIAIIVNSGLLLIVYIVGIGLTSIASRLVGKRFLEKKLSKNKESYWDDLNLKKKPVEEYYRQF